jgi:hypothetical protein
MAQGISPMNRDSAKKVNTKSTSFGYGPTVSDMRMSRLSHPRATVLAILLLAVVFLLFGLFASAVEPSYAPAPSTIDGAMVRIGDWLLTSVS